MKICITGTGYVGLVTGACFADLGNEVICVDNDRKKIENLKKGRIPIYEPGLTEMVKRNTAEGRLSFSTSIASGVKRSEIIFIAVGTPPKDNGEADLTHVENVARQIAKAITGYRLIVEKSTVPVETGKWVEHTLKVNVKGKVKFDVASNPEFLREGSAISDFMNPDRIVIGVSTKRAGGLLKELYRPLKAMIVVTDIKSAEIIKHASNSFLAAKISFINAVANICEKVGANVIEVAQGMGLDKRIGTSFLNAGIGFGGSCFPKDVSAFIRIAEKIGYDFDMLKTVNSINQCQRDMFVRKIEEALWIVSNKTIGVLGLAFKPDTDDIRSAPAIEIIQRLLDSGAKVKAFDPQAMSKTKEVLKKVKFCKDAYETARGADALVIMTEWNEFKEIDLNRLKKIMNEPLILDGRNIYDPQKLKEMGFRYVSIGR